VTCHTVVKMKVYVTVFYSDNSVAVKVMRQNEMNSVLFSVIMFYYTSPEQWPKRPGTDHNINWNVLG
jgi:hypothetical protein